MSDVEKLLKLALNIDPNQPIGQDAATVNNQTTPPATNAGTPQVGPVNQMSPEEIAERAIFKAQFPGGVPVGSQGGGSTLPGQGLAGGGVNGFFGGAADPTIQPSGLAQGALAGSDTDIAGDFFGNAVGPPDGGAAGPGGNGTGDTQTGLFLQPNLTPQLQRILEENGWLGRFQTLLFNVYGDNPDLLDSLIRGGSIGFNDLQRIISQGGIQSPTSLNFLNQISGLFNQAGGGEGGEGGGGGGFGGGGVNTDPFGGELGERIQSILDALLGNPGFDPEILRGLRTQARETVSGREQNIIERRGDEASSTGLFGGGLQERDVRKIEDAATQQLLGSLNQIDLANAEAAQRSVDQAINLIRATISRELGLGNLNVQEAQIALDAALQEILLNFGLFNDFVGDGSDTALDDVQNEFFGGVGGGTGGPEGGTTIQF